MAGDLITVYSPTHLSISQYPTADDALGIIPDALECTVTRDAEGMCEVSMTYPGMGTNVEIIQLNNWLHVPCGGDMGMGYFRIDQVSKDIAGDLSIHACHAYYNCNAMVARPFSVGTNQLDATYYQWWTALETAMNQVDPGQQGNFVIDGWTETLPVNPCTYEEPVTVKQALLDAIQGRGYFLHYTGTGVGIWSNAENVAPQFRIRYGANLLSVTESLDSTEMYTHIYPYLIDDNGTLRIGEDAVYPLQGLPNDYANWRRIKAVNLADYYSGYEGSIDQTVIEISIERWLREHPWDPLPYEINVEMVDTDVPNSYEVGAVGSVYYGNSIITAKIVSMTYDALRDKVTSIGINKRSIDVTDTIAGLSMGRI